MIKYKASRWDWKPKIDSVHVVSETPKTVLVEVNDQYGGARFRESKQCSVHSYFDTWEEAHKFLMEACQGELDSARRRLASAQDRLGNVKGMKPPKQEDAA